MQSKKYNAFFLCLIVAALVSTVASSLVAKKCVEGKSYFDGCNNCFCGAGRTACTLVYCSVWDESLQMNVPKPREEPPADFWQPIAVVEPPRA